MKAYPGNVAPAKEGVYVVTTDSPGHWGYFMGYFNGQYWYEYTRADHYGDVINRPRKRTARLAVTAWADISARSFAEALGTEGVAALDMAGRASMITQGAFDRTNK